MAGLVCSYQALLRITAVLSLFHILNAQAAIQPLLWPGGKYGLPMPYSGCPSSIGFLWESGVRFEDLEDTISITKISPNSHFKTYASDGDLFRYFCVKRNASSVVEDTRPLWPDGNYCIYKKGRWCPMWFNEAWVFWDDENGANGPNRNNHTGTLPNGKYDDNTKIFFCCQSFGDVSSPISLPTARPFYLIAFQQAQCQEVYGTVNRLEQITFDTEDENNQDKWSSLFPVGADGVNNPSINYCYYQACRWTLRALNGVLWTPNYPSHYKNSHICQWNIDVPINYSISLVFLDFKLEVTSFCMDEFCVCDRVDVSEVFPNGSESTVGVYCMGVRFPTGPILSNSNVMVVRFTPDINVQSNGFKAQYSAVMKNVPTTPTTKTAQITTRSQTSLPQTNTSTSMITNNSTTSTPTSNTTTTGNPTSSHVTNISTAQQTSSASAEPTDSTTTGAATSYVPEDTTITHTKEPLDGRVSQQRSSTDSTTVAVICVLVFVAVAGTTIGVSLIFWKRRRKARSTKKTKRWLAEFSSEQKCVSISTLVPGIYGADTDEVHTDVTLGKSDVKEDAQETENPLYDNRPLVDTDGSLDKNGNKRDVEETENPLYASSQLLVCDLEEDRTTDPADYETENPLYASTCQITQPAADDSLQLYESVDSIQGDDVTTVTDNPLYSRSAALGQTDDPNHFSSPMYVRGEI